jgi:hypothetical protein
MLNFDIEKTKLFISELELAEPEFSFLSEPELPLKLLEEGKKEGYVNLANLVSFVAGIGDSNKADVLNSVLLAQLAANKKFDRENDTQGWYKFYREVLENVGWVIQGFDFDKVNTAGGDFTVDKVVLEILAAIATGDELAVVQSTINALKSLSDGDDRLVLYESSSHSAQKGNFQISPVTESGGIVAMRILAFYFSTTQNVDRVLFFTYSSASAELYKSSQTINLNKDVYAQVRNDIIIKLGNKAKTFVRNLDIG